MNRQEAINWCQSKLGQALDFDGAYGAQCVDFFNFYYLFVTKRNPYSDGYGVEGAKDLWNVNHSQLIKVPATPDPNQLPSTGDILIHNGNLAGSGGYGHVSIIASATSSGYTVYEQNWGGMYVKKQYHPWNGTELGWLVPKVFTTNTIGGPAVETIKSMYWRLLGRQADAGGIATYTKAAQEKGWEFVYNDLKNSKEGQDDWDRRNPDRVAQLERAIGEKDRLLADLKVALANEQNKPPKEVVKEVEKIVEVPVEVVKEVPVYVSPDEKQVVTNWFIKIWNSLFNK